MEKFQQIDWTTNVEDIVDEKFLNEERLRKEAAMYRIMNGTFQDPFKNFRRFAPANDHPAPKSPPKQQPKRFANNSDNRPSLGVVVKKRGRPKKQH